MTRSHLRQYKSSDLHSIRTSDTSEERKHNNTSRIPLREKLSREHKLQLGPNPLSLYHRDFGLRRVWSTILTYLRRRATHINAERRGEDGHLAGAVDGFAAQKGLRRPERPRPAAHDTEYDQLRRDALQRSMVPRQSTGAAPNASR